MRAFRWLPIAFVLACQNDPAELTMSLVGPAVASAQYFHGNCFAGFSVALDLQVRETRSVGVVVTRFTYRITDQSSGLVMAEETLDQASFDERFGARASVIPAQGTRTLRLGGTSSERPRGPIVVTGEIEAIDENDGRVEAAYQLSTDVVVDNGSPPESGACTSP